MWERLLAGEHSADKEGLVVLNPHFPHRENNLQAKVQRDDVVLNSLEFMGFPQAVAIFHTSSPSVLQNM